LTAHVAFGVGLGVVAEEFVGVTGVDGFQDRGVLVVGVEIFVGVA